ncbi:hypothetical protein TREPR_0623 [Treponema primitia ZAS-2]|uniref:Uncharacterized protein n=1 Tax=Treponema primitia (strain ATCC BAA-887 / DSM 12427 / ZAS-2) TaxID=545694 RepID=F5YKM1_TREPZ|nr:hypothetical protein [Treponema primitia]AEF86612.1 hypothetical protein TREPR_0623 [Treponema primitia ZAS-2]
MKITQIGEILNEKAKTHRIGEIQVIRYKMGLQGKKAIQRLFLISEDTLQWWGNWVLLFGGHRDFMFSLSLDSTDRLWYGLSFPLQNKGMYAFRRDDPKLKKCYKSFNKLYDKSPDLFSDYTMWREVNRSIVDITQVQKINNKTSDGVEAIFIGKAVKLNDIDYEEILTTFDNMIGIYIKVNSGDLEASYENLKEPPPKPKEIWPWSDEVIKRTLNDLPDLVFGVDLETRSRVMLKRNDGTYGHITLVNALNRVYTVVDKDENVEYYSDVHEMVKAGWVLD